LCAEKNVTEAQKIGMAEAYVSFVFEELGSKIGSVKA
jgi:hypothetical protein